ncbi:MAG TPA: Calx-beta domain-containing protein [Planctomycetota bacterium]|nr:Calx-beta domain-containing protein [Planctomycetota bacterium]
MRKIGLYLAGLAMAMALHSSSVHAAAANVTVTTAVAGVAPTTVTAGGTANINLSVTDTVASSTSNVTISVVLPAGMALNGTLTTPQSGFTASGTTTITFANAAFTSTSAVTLTIPVKIASSQTGSITIAAPTVTFTDSSTKNPAPTGATVAIATSADLSITITNGNSPVAPGPSARSYNITIANNGPSDCPTATINVTTPAGTTFQSCNYGSGVVPTSGTKPAVGTAGTTSLTGALTVGQNTVYLYTENILTNAPASIIDTATSSSSTTDPISGNNTATSTFTVNQSADLALTMTTAVATTVPANSVAVGDVITYTLNLSNNGPNSAAGAVVTSTFPANTTFVSAVQNSGPAFTKAVGGTSVTFAITSGNYDSGVANNAQFTIKYSVNQGVAAGVTITHTPAVSAAANVTDPTPGNNSATSSLTTVIDSDLAITNAQANPTTVTPPQNVTYTFTLANNGPTNATGATFSAVMPPGTSFVSAAQTSGPAFTLVTPIAGATSGTISVTPAALAAGASATFQVVLTLGSSLASNSTVSFTATASSTTADLVSTNNSATMSDTVSPRADLTLAILAAPSPVIQNGSLTYTCTVTNNGPDVANGVSFAFPIASGTSFVSATVPAGWTQTSTNNPGDTSGTITETIPTLASGASGVIVIKVNVSATAPIGSMLSSPATVTATSPADPIPANNNNNPNVVVAAPPSVSINSISLNEGNAGTTLATFTLTLSAAAQQQAQVDYATVDGTAKAPQDYTSQVGTAAFLVNATTATFTVPIVGNTLVEPDKTFTVHLSNPVALTIGTNDGTCTIKNDDFGGTLQFSKANYVVNENAGTATITVTRTAGQASGVTIAYTTSDGTALNGTDYTTASGTLTFNAGDSSKTFTITLLNKYGAVPGATVGLALSNAQGGGAIGAQSTAVLTILAAPAFSSALSISSQISLPLAYAMTATGEAPITFAIPNPALLPPGLTFSSGFITGVPTLVGSFAVPITATNAVGTDTQTLVLNITAVPNAPGTDPNTIDSDGDGFPDIVEIAAGTNPLDSKSTPINNAPAQVLSISNVKLGIALNFSKKSSDSITLSGTVVLPQGFLDSGKLVYFAIGGVTRRFALDANGSAKIGADTVKFRFGNSLFTQTGTFVLTIRKADAAALFVNEGLTSGSAEKSPRTVPIYVVLNTNLYRVLQPQVYTANGKTGKTKNP